MKNTVFLVGVSVLICIFIFAREAFSWYAYNQSNQLEILQCFNESLISASHKWITADAIILPLAGTAAANDEGDSADTYTIEPFFFEEFDYLPDIKTDILKSLHKPDNFSVPSERAGENTYFYVKYDDIYDNPPGAGYPKLTLTYPNGSTQTYTMAESAETGVYFYEILLPRGEYSYAYSAANDNYAGEYSISGNWYVTTRPYGFNPVSPADNTETVPDNTLFKWTVNTDETPDVLTYGLYLGFDNNKAALPLYGSSFSANAVSSFVSGERIISNLKHKRRYFWYMKISNKYGADIETTTYTFVTGGMVEKFYNAPNPFNPARGQRTKFVYTMEQDGNAKITLYSEYGDKVWESGEYFGSGQTSVEIDYDGKDNSGRLLYNGSYIAVLTKKYGGSSKTEKCRILIIK
jgi:hypothetical protein